MRARRRRATTSLRSSCATTASEHVTTMQARTTIRLKNRLAELERVAGALAEFARQQRLATKVAFDLGLAVDEVLTNVMRYAYDGEAEREITVHVGRRRCGGHRRDRGRWPPLRSAHDRRGGRVI